MFYTSVITADTFWNKLEQSCFLLKSSLSQHVHTCGNFPANKWSIFPNSLDMLLFSIFSSLWCLQMRGEPGKIPLYLLYILSKIFHAPSCQYPGVGVVNDPSYDTYSLIMIKHHIFPISFTSTLRHVFIKPTQEAEIHFFLHYSKNNFFFFQDDNSLSNAQHFHNN